MAAAGRHTTAHPSPYYYGDERLRVRRRFQNTRFTQLL